MGLLRGFGDGGESGLCGIARHAQIFMRRPDRPVRASVPQSAQKMGAISGDLLGGRREARESVVVGDISGGGDPLQIVGDGVQSAVGPRVEVGAEETQRVAALRGLGPGGGVQAVARGRLAGRVLLLTGRSRIILPLLRRARALLGQRLHRERLAAARVTVSAIVTAEEIPDMWLIRIPPTAAPPNCTASSR